MYYKMRKLNSSKMLFARLDFINKKEKKNIMLCLFIFTNSFCLECLYYY